LAQAGLSISAIAQQMGLHRETVRSFLRAETFPERVIPAGRPSSVAPFADYLRERWRAGCISAKKLHQEIRARGFKGAPVTVRRYVSGWRKRAHAAANCALELTIAHADIRDLVQNMSDNAPDKQCESFSSSNTKSRGRLRRRITKAAFGRLCKRLS
jgi:transposase